MHTIHVKFQAIVRYISSSITIGKKKEIKDSKYIEIQSVYFTVHYPEDIHCNDFQILPEVGLRLDDKDDGTPKGLLCPSPRGPKRELTGKAGCPSMENAPGKCARCANGNAAAIPAGLNGEAPGRQNAYKYLKNVHKRLRKWFLSIINEVQIQI